MAGQIIAIPDDHRCSAAYLDGGRRTVVGQLVDRTTAFEMEKKCCLTVGKRKNGKVPVSEFSRTHEDSRLQNPAHQFIFNDLGLASALHYPLATK